MLPDKFKEKMKSLLGESEYTEFLSSFDKDDERIHALRLNPAKKCAEPVTAAFDLDKKVPWEDEGYYYDADKTPGKHPFHEAGLYYIQEPSAMAPVAFLDPQPGDKVLDLCAAPGGKSTQIAGRLRGRGVLVTNEIMPDRARILSLNIERLGICNAMVLNEDSVHLADVFEGYFDKILVDAPCSGEGMFRKNEEAFDEWSAENVEKCAERQRMILDNAARMLRPGGRLVYSTCTFSPEEDEENVFDFLLRHEDFTALETNLLGGMEHGRKEFVSGKHLDQAEDKAEDLLIQTSRSVRLWPHKVNGEGHFLCVFKRDGESDRENDNYVPGGRITPAKKDMTAPFTEFAESDLTPSGRDKLVGTYMKFGDQLYLAFDKMPNPAGLKVLRPGLHLGTVKKDRFEPSHALALFLDKEDVRLSFDLDSDKDMIKQYLNGQTIRLSAGDASFSKEKGWCMITTDGYSIGWCKLAGGMLKNHYPKGLRINY